MADRLADDGSASNWRDKYLELLDEHETLERQCNEQQNLMSRALVRVSISADGQDKQLDTALERLRDHLRSGDASGLQPLLERLDKALLAFDEQRQQVNQALISAIGNTVRPLENLSLNRSIHQKIKTFQAQLPDDVQTLHRYPEVFQTLAAIYEQSVGYLQAPRAGLLGKLFGKPEAAVEPVNDETEPGAQDTVVVAESTPSESAQTANHEYAIVEHIRPLFEKLLNDLSVPEEFAERFSAIRKALAESRGEAELISGLEQVRDFVVDVCFSLNRTFANYLNNVNQELADIQRVLGGATEQHENRQRDAQQWHVSMLQQMSDLEQGTSEASDLSQLKTMVNSQLGNIRESLKGYQQGELEHQKLFGQLQELAKKVKAMEAEAEANRSSLEKQRFKALHDPLTELPNREAYNERIANEYHRWLRYRHPLTIAMCDLDHFKHINDTFGHQAGDRVLRFISRSIARRLRDIDFFGRYGGEEFVVIMPDTTREQAFAVLEKIRATIAATSFNYKNEPMPITLSVGITQFEEGDRIETALARADTALYSAKKNGRNRCQLG